MGVSAAQRLLFLMAISAYSVPLKFGAIPSSPNTTRPPILHTLSSSAIAFCVSPNRLIPPEELKNELTLIFKEHQKQVDGVETATNDIVIKGLETVIDDIVKTTSFKNTENAHNETMMTFQYDLEKENKAKKDVEDPPSNKCSSTINPGLDILNANVSTSIRCIKRNIFLKII